MPALASWPQKITLAEMRASGVRGLLIYCSDFRCSPSAGTDGPMTSACPTWSRGLPARLAADAALMCGPIGNRLKLMPDKGRLRRAVA